MMAYRGAMQGSAIRGGARNSRRCAPFRVVSEGAEHFHTAHNCGLDRVLPVVTSLPKKPPPMTKKADIQLLRLRVRTALNARASGNAFLQYNSTTDRVDLNLRLRYNVSEGTDLWIVYNEGLDTERETFTEQRTPLSLSRALIVKYSHTFTF